VKFPAVLRKDVYRTKPSDVQESFSRRIRNEAGFEDEQKQRLLAFLQERSNEPPDTKRALRMLRSALLMKLELGRRFGLRPGRQIDAIRRFKGLD
jgi:hypothetical protein